MVLASQRLRSTARPRASERAARRRRPGGVQSPVSARGSDWPSGAKGLADIDGLGMSDPAVCGTRSRSRGRVRSATNRPALREPREHPRGACAARPWQSAPADDPVAAMASGSWHACGMARTRLSTTVDAELLEGARGLRVGSTDASLVDEALRALMVRHRSAEVDASYSVYDEHPVNEPDEWGDLATWRQAASAS